MLREGATRLVGGDDPGSQGGVGGRVLLHASCVELAGIGVVLRGPSGSGKSDLALRLIDGGARLVADDRVVVERDGDVLIASPPDSIAGLIEVRGLGIMRISHRVSSVLGLVIALGRASWPRLPERVPHELLGITLPYFELDPWAPSACAKVRLALTAERFE